MSPSTDKPSLLLRHVALPALAPLTLLALYFTPLAVIGCVERGLLALTVSASAAVAAFGCAAMAFRARARGDHRSSWWMLSTAILALSLALLLGPLR